VYIVALEQGLLSTVAIPLEVFRLMGLPPDALGANAASPLFDARVVSTRGSLQAFGGVGLHVASIASMPRPDLVFVGSGGFQAEAVAQAHTELGALLRRWHQAGTCIAAVCTGVIVLAECGLLNGLRATTHWAVAPWFRARYPKVRLSEDQMVTQEARLWCGAGGYAAQDLALQLATHFSGQAASRQAGQTLLLDAPRTRQTPYMTTAPRRDHEDPLVARVQREISLHPARDFAISELAQACCLSPRSLMRRFRLATGTTVLDYQQGLRIDEAKHLLADSDQSVANIGVAVGYEDSAFFRGVFKRKVGITPTEYRRRTRRMSSDSNSQEGE
jgi:transcriptional regulator GlxA family with amidase domain